jgi:fimbrial isopeptide formation D2 family protein/LPXTG-motif cell wall-anchored protein
MEGTSKLTVTISDPNVNFNLYQIFQGKLVKVGETETKTLTGITWGASVKGHEADLIAALKADKLSDGTTNPIKEAFANATDAASVASALISIGEDSTKADAFAQIVGDVIVSQSDVVYRQANSGTTPATNSQRYHAVFNQISDGYYFVAQTSLSNATNPSMSTYSKYMLKVAGPSTVDAKRTADPSLDKVIVTTDEDGKETTNRFDEGAIGDTVTFKLKSAVPSMDGYTKYFFVVKDELSKGLTFDSITKITIGDKVLTEDEYNLYTSADDDELKSELEDENDSAIKIVFKNFKQYDTSDYVGKDIAVYYTATINTDATIGKASANVNKAKLEYSNNPNFNYKGKTDDPDDPSDEDKKGGDDDGNGGIGSTPWAAAYVYTTGINLIKVDSSTNERLEGAQFKITGTKLNTLITKKYTFNPVGYYSQGAVEGGYYKHDDGAFNQIELTDDIKDDYVEDYVMYDSDHNVDLEGAYYYDKTTGEYVDEITDAIANDEFDMDYIIYESVESEDNINIIEKEEDVEYIGTVGTNGVLELNGLGAGEYTITEVTAPDGYNILKNAITVTIKFDEPTAGAIDAGCTWHYYVNLNDGSDIKDSTGNENGIYDLKVANSVGSTLPSTGGIGTRVFYGVGSVLLIGAAILLITKRRMSAVEND